MFEKTSFWDFETGHMAPLHAILASQRSGTTLFRSILNTHPRVHAFDEVYGGLRPQREPNYLGYLLQQVSADPAYAVPKVETLKQLFQDHHAKLEALTPEAAVRLVDIKYTHVHRFNPLNYHILELPYVLRCIHASGGTVLHVIRKNLLATYTSAVIAKRNASYRATKAELVRETCVTMDAMTTLQELENRDREIEHFRTLLKGSAVKEIYYEDMIQDGLFSETVLSQLAQSWSVGMDFDRKPEREKIVPPLSQAIINFSEIEEKLAPTKFAWMTQA